MASDERTRSKQQYAPGIASAGRFNYRRGTGNRAKNRRTAEAGVDFAESCGRTGWPHRASSGFSGACAGAGGQKSVFAGCPSPVEFASLEFFGGKNGGREPQFAGPASAGADRLRPAVRLEV